MCKDTVAFNGIMFIQGFAKAANRFKRYWWKASNVVKVKVKVKLDRRLGGPQNRSGCGDKEKKIPIPCWDSKPPIIQPIAQCSTT
jgi:hypothetical protein